MKAVKCIKYIQIALKVLCAIVICSLTVILGLQIIKRNVFLSSFTWAEELSTISMVWITFLGAALAVITNQNTRIDFFIRKLPAKAYHSVLVFDDLVCMAFCGVIIKYSWRAIGKNLSNLTPALKLPVSVNYAGIFTGFVLMLLFFALRIVLEFMSLAGKDTGEIEKELAK